jgi:GAF domain-containing protein
VDRLLEQQVLLIAERFGFYHVGVYLIDDAKEYAVLRASNSEGGRRMLERGYKLRLGTEGIVGWVGGAGRPRVAFDMGVGQQYFNDPDLPQTRSEAALPLRIRERVIGVLDLQSTKPSAFTPEDISVLQILADQIALAVENARLFEETQQTLQAIDRLYSQQTQQAWYQRLRERPVAFRYDRLGVQAAPGELEIRSMPQRAEVRSEGGRYELVAPISVRGQVLGTLVLRRDAGQPAWMAEDVALVELMLGQVIPALENARLLEEVQARAAREQAVNVITSRVRSSISMDAILQNAARELGLALGATRTFVQVGLEQISEDTKKGKGGSDENQ